MGILHIVPKVAYTFSTYLIGSVGGAFSRDLI